MIKSDLLFINLVSYNLFLNILYDSKIFENNYYY